MEYDFEEMKHKTNSNRKVKKLCGDIVGAVQRFMYLIRLQKNFDFAEDMKHKIKCGWLKWKEAQGILYNKKIPIGLKSKFYKAVVRLPMILGLQYLKEVIVILFAFHGLIL